MLTAPSNIANYDFPFDLFFTCQHPYQYPAPITTIARIGAPSNYAELYESLTSEGIQLIHTPDDHLKCTELPYWYPLLKDITPKSMWFAELPTIDQVLQEFDWPIFIKGA